MSIPATTTGYSARELQAAAAALAAGRFSEQALRREHLTTARENAVGRPDPTDAHSRHAAWPASAVEESRAQTMPPEIPPEIPPEVPSVAPRGVPAAKATGAAPLVRVTAANAGAGASTLTLALADAADAAGLRTRILDAATPAWSGLTGATVTELGAAQGWRRGRRGQAVIIDRVEQATRSPLQVPPPRHAEGIDLTLLDAGWSPRELAAADAPAWITATPADVELLVIRPHTLALSQTEVVLADREEALGEGRVLIVVVGNRRWSDRHLAAAGQRLRSARAHNAVLFTPVLPARALPALGPDPVPKQLTQPAQRLLEQITAIAGPLAATRTEEA